MPAIVPEGHTRVREAIYALALIRHAGVDFSQAVQDVREHGFHDIRFTRQELEASAAKFWAEVDSERLSVWIEHMTSGGMLKIAPELLQPIPFVRRYTVSDLTYLRPHDLLTFHLKQRFRLEQHQTFADWASRFQLLVRDSDLGSLQVKSRQTRKRRLSRPLSTVAPGRPSKAAALQPVIREVVESGRWRFPQSLKELTRLVNRSGSGSGVSETTVARALDALSAENGDIRYHRPKKSQREASSRQKPSGRS